MRRLPPVLARLSIIALLLGVLTGAPVTAANYQDRKSVV